MLISIGEAALMVGGSASTLRRWEREGRLSSVRRTLGCHRRYDPQELPGFMQPDAGHAARKTILYARVSGSDQRRELARQIERLQAYAS